MNTTATVNEDCNDVAERCRACGAITYGLVQVSLGDVWLGAIPLCDECQQRAAD